MKKIIVVMFILLLLIGIMGCEAQTATQTKPGDVGYREGVDNNQEHPNFDTDEFLDEHEDDANRV